MFPGGGGGVGEGGGVSCRSKITKRFRVDCTRHFRDFRISWPSTFIRVDSVRVVPCDSYEVFYDLAHGKSQLGRLSVIDYRFGLGDG